MSLTGEFVFIVDGQLVTYTDYNNIPEEFDHMIKFSPDIPPPPHTHEQHLLLEKIEDLFRELVNKERLRYGNG